MTAISLNLEPLVQGLTHEQFYKLCMVNQDLAMERRMENGEWRMENGEWRIGKNLLSSPGGEKFFHRDCLLPSTS